MIMWIRFKRYFNWGIFVVIVSCNGTPPNLLDARPEIDLKSRLRKEHPRLIFSKDQQQHVENLAGDDYFLQQLIASLMTQADHMLALPTIEYNLEGPRLLHQSRNCFSKVMTLSMAYRFTGEIKYANRALMEMKVAAGFPDWNPGHFLDVAEMCTALAIGYDWLFDIIHEDDKKLIRDALIEKGLKPGLLQYPDGFANKLNNWNFVCNGGLIIAALAIAEYEHGLAEEILSKAFTSLPVALKNFAPDGAWFEGPSYWMYGTNYLSMLWAALESAVGTDFGLSDYQGIGNSGNFYLSSIGPSGNFFNYSDCRLQPDGPAPALLWLSHKYDIPFYTYAERHMLDKYFRNLDARNYGLNGDQFHHRFFPLEIAWYDPRTPSDTSMTQLDVCFKGVADVVYLRSSWDPDGFFVGFKGGNNAINHAHLDCGSFVLEALGERWAEDLGYDDYNLPGYFEYKQDGRRWNYFRNSSLSHNVLTINGKNQLVEGSTNMVAYFSSPELAHAVADLSNVYLGQATSVQRGMAMLNRRQFLIQDEIVTLNSHDTVRWAMVTSADIQINSNKALLELGEEEIVAELIEPRGGHFTVASTRPDYHPQEENNTGTRLLTVSVPLKTSEMTRLVILLTPKTDQKNHLNAGEIEVIPLHQWKGSIENHNK